MKHQNIIIIGAGLCGSLLALRLAQRGHSVKVFEKRPDLRKTDISAGKSINLAFSNRGMKAMKKVGILDQIMPLCIPMKGRMIHDKEQNTFLSPYSGRPDNYIYSVSRGGLNGVLLDHAEKHPNVTIYFNHEAKEVDFLHKKATFETENQLVEHLGDVIYGTDGAGSALRKNYEKQREFLFSLSQDFLDHGYKEFEFPATPNGDFAIDKNALHIWPRGDYMLIALPNLDASFTVTLFLSHQNGTYNFESLQNPDTLREFFEKEFPDALPLIPNLTKEFQENPTGNLGTVKCHPWNFKDHSLLMGDAAHAIVPFYGQGMNASFEDVAVLDEYLDKYGDDWESLFEAYQKDRKKDSDAIADLAIDNFYEMRDHVANPYFKEKRAIEMKLESEFPDEYYSKYSWVTFREDIPYHEAMQKGRMQDEVILRLIYTQKIQSDMPAETLFSVIQEELSKEYKNQEYKSIWNEKN